MQAFGEQLIPPPVRSIELMRDAQSMQIGTGAEPPSLRTRSGVSTAPTRDNLLMLTLSCRADFWLNEEIAPALPSRTTTGSTCSTPTAPSPVARW